MNFILIITSLLTVVVAQQPSLHCNYRINEGRYACDLSINNPNGLNNFTEIGGIHLDGFTNADAIYIFRISGASTNIPSIICETFPNLNVFDFSNAGVTEVDDNAFASCSNITGLSLLFNRITSISANAFVSLPEIEFIDLENNSLTTLPANVFASQRSLTSLKLSHNAFLTIPVGLFDPLENLENLELSDNRIDYLSPDVFASFTNIDYIGLRNNNVRTLVRRYFGSLISLRTLDLDGNIFNAIAREIIDDAVNLNTLSLNGNLCANRHFGNFLISRVEYLPILERCFINARYDFETTTEGDNEFSFFEAPQPGVNLRFRADNEVQIALTPFNFTWSSMIEVFLGTTNNTRLVIRVNQETNVVTVPTPNILYPSIQLNDFRISWANQVILVFRGTDSLPFMAYTMQDFFPVNFFGLRAVETAALWSLQPFQL